MDYQLHGTYSHTGPLCLVKTVLLHTDLYLMGKDSQTEKHLASFVTFQH